MLASATPEQMRMSAGRLAELHAELQGLVDKGQFAGIATLIARRGQVVDSRCYGLLDIAAKKPLRPDSLFRLASLTKPVTSVAALMLFDEGRFDLDEPVSKWIPRFEDFRVMPSVAGEAQALGELERDITFRHLLTHTAGLGYGMGPTPFEAQYAQAKFLSPISNLQVSLPELIQRLPELPLAAQPGTIFTYSLAHDVLGYLIGMIAGQPLDVFLRERLFKPLGMADTGFFVPAEKLDRLGPLYNARGQEPSLTVADPAAGSAYANPNAVLSGGGGLVSTLADYWRFALMLAQGGELDGVRYLRPSTFAAMTTNQLPASAYGGGGDAAGDGYTAGDGYGLGVGVRVAADPAQGLPAGAFGWGGSTGTRLLVCPREELVEICMVQAFVDGRAGEVLLKGGFEALPNV